jgi:perosamine synthetase
VTTFSFFATKNITTGEGGAVSTRDPKIFTRAKEFSRQGLIRDRSRFVNSWPGAWHQEVHDFGLNYRLTDFQCALGISQLSRIEEIKIKRQRVYEFYEQAFQNESRIRRIIKNNNVEPLWHLYPIFVNDKARIFNELREKGIGVQVNYVPAYKHPVFVNRGYQITQLESSEKFYREEISLPMYSGLTEEMLLQVSNSVIHSL